MPSISQVGGEAVRLLFDPCFVNASDGLRQAGGHIEAARVGVAHIAIVAVNIEREGCASAQPVSARAHLEPAGRLDAWTALARDWCERLTPYWLGSHDTDLHAADNTSLALAASGFGIERTGLDVDDPAGLEHNRGTMRYCANWLTYHSDALTDRLDPATPLPEALSTTRLVPGTLYQLYPTPADGFTPEGRQRQRAFRDAMGYLPAAQREQPLLGYWQKRGRP